MSNGLIILGNMYQKTRYAKKKGFIFLKTAGLLTINWVITLYLSIKCGLVHRQTQPIGFNMLIIPNEK